jgi:hypothetical protein
MSELGVAFKEWAVMCKALAEGRQAIILRKGGVAERGGTFRAEHTRFWLYPTYVHQQEGGVIDEWRPLLEQAKAERPPQGVVRFTHFVEVPGIYHVSDLAKAFRLASLHGWTQETVEARFNYHTPGLYVLPARVHRSAQTFEIPELAHYAGCKSWVELDRPLAAEGEPVLAEAAFDAVLSALDRLLEPTAWA